MYLKQRVSQQVLNAVQALQAEGLLPQDTAIVPELERPSQSAHGDFSTNIAMKLSKTARKAPKVIAEALVKQLGSAEACSLLESVEVAGPGFVNLKVRADVLLSEVTAIRQAQEQYGTSEIGTGRKLLLEFVSANPTGPLNIVSARAAAVGDSLANILKSQGVEVEREYYINDAGNQAFLLGESLRARYLQSLGETASVPEEGYQGEYIKELAVQIAAENSAEIQKARESSAPAKGMSELLILFKEKGVEKIVSWHREALRDYGVEFTTWFSELQLHTSGEVDAALEDLKSRKYIFNHEGAVWFRSTDFGDDKDRVLIKADGLPAYIAADIAYHRNKFNRGFTELVDIWGPDHHGYIPRMKAAMQALGHEANAFHVLIAQQVNLLENGQPIAMSKRAGQFVTMADLIKDVGRDVARFFFLMRSTDAHLDFDLDLARKHSEDNPVYYVQYAYARICSILKKALAEGLVLPGVETPILGISQAKSEELALIRELAAYPEILSLCAEKLEPHGLAFYLRDVATAFHRFYTVCRVVDLEARECSVFRLTLIDAVRTILKNGLALLGISAPESM